MIQFNFGKAFKFNVRKKSRQPLPLVPKPPAARSAGGFCRLWVAKSDLSRTGGSRERQGRVQLNALA
jgi:hypothetical protein